MKPVKSLGDKFEDLTSAFKEQCEAAIKQLKKAIEDADKPCPFEAEASVGQALCRLREAIQIVKTAADYYQFSEPWCQGVKK